MTTDLGKLLGIIEKKLDWGAAGSWQSRDFENLNQRILEETGVSLSASTLRRIWGRVEYNHLPSTTTLDTLAKFAGNESWRSFTKITAAEPIVTVIAPGPILQKKAQTASWQALAAGIIIVVATSVISLLAFKKAPPAVIPGNYSFSIQPLTRTLPNSVIFTYDASMAATDSIFIQQSWDPATRSAVEKNEHQHTSVYFEPGFYQAKLVVGDEIVQQQDLIIPTDGWLGIIENKPVPVYLKAAEYLHDGFIGLPVEVITQKNIPLQPNPPIIKYSNVGNFDPVPVNDFSFSADIKNDYPDGAGACQLSAVFLITNGNPIIIPLGIKGCSAELNLLSVDQMISGKKTDLSGFGTDLSRWVNVSCKSTAHSIQYYVNQQLALECPQPVKPVQIVGMAYNFQGTGEVKNISLRDKDKVIFKAF